MVQGSGARLGRITASREGWLARGEWHKAIHFTTRDRRVARRYARRTACRFSKDARGIYRFRTNGATLMGYPIIEKDMMPEKTFRALAYGSF